MPFTTRLLEENHFHVLNMFPLSQSYNNVRFPEPLHFHLEPQKQDGNVIQTNDSNE